MSVRFDPILGQLVSDSGSGGGGSGNVVGPTGGSTDNAVARFDGADGKSIQNSPVIIDDAGNLSTPTGLSSATSQTSGNSTVGGNLILSSTTALRALITDASKNATSSVTTSAELAFLSGTTSAVQTQLDSKIPLTQRGVANGVATLDANGLIPTSQIPQAALERLVIVANQAARFALTSSQVQEGDTVKQNDTGILYYVVDINNLNNASGYEVYAAGTAASVPYSGITGLPPQITNLSGTNTGDVTLGTVGSTPNSSGASLSGQILTIQPADGSNPGVLTAGTQTLGGNKTFTGTVSASNLSGSNTGDQTISLTGDVVGSGTGSFATTIQPNVVANSKLAQMPTLTIKGNNTGATGNALDLTAAQVRALLGVVVPSPGDIQETSFSAANNQATSNITGLSFAAGTVRSFEVILSVALVATTPKYVTYKFLGINKNGSFEMDQSFVGDGSTSGLTFAITSAGQVTYSSSNATGFVSDTFKFRAQTLSV